MSICRILGALVAFAALALAQAPDGDAQTQPNSPRESLRRSEADYQRALRDGNLDAQAQAWNNIGIAHYYLGEYAEALDSYRNCLAIAERRGDELRVADALNNMGIIHYYWGQYQQTLDCYARVLEIRRRRGDRRGVAETQNNFGNLYYATGRNEEAPATIPLMVSRGCSYGKCTFCAESNRDGKVIRTSDYDWIEALVERAPGAALYFQDSIFPAGNGSSSELLPLLRHLGREWGCQVYLPTLTERRVAELADHGCTYLYTGVESGAATVLGAIQKPAVTRDVVVERMRWARRHDVRMGLSLMFGSMAVTGELLETAQTLEETCSLAHAILDSGVSVTGFYPNVQTVLPGTALARGLAGAGSQLNFYAMPRCQLFDSLEDGGVGYNFLTVAEPDNERLAIAEHLVATAHEVQAMAGGTW